MVEIITFMYHSDGMEHVNYLMTSMLPSLMKPSNIPEIMKTEKVIHNIYCHAKDVDYLRANYTPMAAAQGLPSYYYPMIVNRNNLFVGVYDQFQRALKNDSKVIISTADLIWSGGMAAAVKKVNKGEALYGPTLRVKSSEHEKVVEFLKTEHPNKDFSKLFIEDIPHKLLEIAKEKRWDYCTLEKTPEGWNYYHKEPVPMVYWPSEDIVKTMDIPMKTIEILDHWMTQLLYDSGRCKCVFSNDEIFIGELTLDTMYNVMFDNK
jgi:hypothetical protein